MFQYSLISQVLKKKNLRNIKDFDLFLLLYSTVYINNTNDIHQISK